MFDSMTMWCVYIIAGANILSVVIPKFLFITDVRAAHLTLTWKAGIIG